jgi:hypothetical protein
MNRIAEEEERKARICEDLERLQHINTKGMKPKDVYRWAILNRMESNACILDEFYEALKDIMHHYIVSMELVEVSTVPSLSLTECFAFKIQLCSNVFFLKDIWILQARYTYRYINNFERLFLILCQRWIPPVRKQEDLYNWDMLCSVPMIDPYWNISIDGEGPLLSSLDVLEKNSEFHCPLMVKNIIKCMTEDRAEIMKIADSAKVVDNSDLVFGSKAIFSSVPTFYQMKLHVNWLEYCQTTLEDESRAEYMKEESERFKMHIESRMREALKNGRMVIKHEPEDKDKQKKRSKNKRKADVRARRGM